MRFAELELKRGDTIVLKADLSSVKLNIDVTEQLFLTIKDSDGIIKISKDLSPGTLLMVGPKYYSCIKH